MTKDQLLETVDEYLKRLRAFSPIRADPAKFAHELTQTQRCAHMCWMLEHMKKQAEKDELEKAFRWLGFVQGSLYEMGFYTVDELRTHNQQREVP